MTATDHQDIELLPPVHLDRKLFPKAFEARVRTLMDEQELTRSQAEHEAERSPIELEIRYEEGYGLFATEPEANETGRVRSPYSGRPLTDGNDTGSTGAFVQTVESCRSAVDETADCLRQVLHDLVEEQEDGRLDFHSDKKCQICIDGVWHTVVGVTADEVLYRDTLQKETGRCHMARLKAEDIITTARAVANALLKK